MRKLKPESGPTDKEMAEKHWSQIRTPEGNINNCALGYGEEEKSCQMCKGTCPDRDRFIVPPAQSSVADVSKKLAQTMEDAEKEAKLSAARAAVFENPYAAKEHPMPTPMRRIVEHHFDDDETDIAVEHKALEKLLDSSERVGHQSNALEQAETNARRAMKLYLRFRQARFEWEQDNKVVFSSMRIEATKALQAEKQSGTRSKQITDADVETMCASLFPDEMRAQEVRRNKAHLTEKSLEHLVEVWSSKCRSLNALVGKGR